MNTRFIFITLLFPFCCALLRAQAPPSTILNKETTIESKVENLSRAMHSG